MLGSTILEIAIGLVFIFALTGAICTTINELIESILKKRARYLEDALREMLNDKQGTGIVKSFYEHPLISSLFKGEYNPTTLNKRISWGRGLPSYIPSRNFALALLDLVVPQVPHKDSTGASLNPLSVEVIKNNISTLKSLPLQRAVLLALNTAGDDIGKARAELEKWFDTVMDRTSGWYKRASQQVTFVIALIVVVICNIDSLALVDYLSHDRTQRELLVANATRYVDGQQASNQTPIINCPPVQDAQAGKPCNDKQTSDPVHPEPDARHVLESLNLPIGWNDGQNLLTQVWNGLSWRSATGWFLTAIAASLGAPFWFDLLNKFMVIRSTVKPHEKSQEEASEDRQ